MSKRAASLQAGGQGGQDAPALTMRPLPSLRTANSSSTVIQPQPPVDWEGARGNVEDCKLAVQALRSLVNDAIFLDEEAYSGAITLAAYQSKVLAQQRRMREMEQEIAALQAEVEAKDKAIAAAAARAREAQAHIADLQEQLDSNTAVFRLHHEELILRDEEVQRLKALVEQMQAGGDEQQGAQQQLSQTSAAAGAGGPRSQAAGAAAAAGAGLRSAAAPAPGIGQAQEQGGEARVTGGAQRQQASVVPGGQDPDSQSSQLAPGSRGARSSDEVTPSSDTRSHFEAQQSGQLQGRESSSMQVTEQTGALQATRQLQPGALPLQQPPGEQVQGQRATQAGSPVHMGASMLSLQGTQSAGQLAQHRQQDLEQLQGTSGVGVDFFGAQEQQQQQQQGGDDWLEFGAPDDFAPDASGGLSGGGSMSRQPGLDDDLL